MYIATLVEGHWGIQSRFGTDTEVFWGNPEDDRVDRHFDAERNAAEAEGIVRSTMAASASMVPGRCATFATRT